MHVHFFGRNLYLSWLINCYQSSEKKESVDGKSLTFKNGDLRTMGDDPLCSCVMYKSSDIYFCIIFIKYLCLTCILQLTLDSRASILRSISVLARSQYRPNTFSMLQERVQGNQEVSLTQRKSGYIDAAD